MGVKPAQPTTQLDLSSIPDLKIKYIEPLREHVIEPLRADLVRLRAQLVAAKADLEIQQVDHALRVLDQEEERAKTLRLSDFDVPVGVIGESTELTTR
jgi:hypothetical protein